MYLQYVPPTRQRAKPYRWHSFTHSDYVFPDQRQYWHTIMGERGFLALVEDQTVDWILANIPAKGFRFEFRWRGPSHCYFAFKFRKKSDAMRFKLACF